ncbi:hypothetical protein IM793_20715 [Pedobacter sp. MR2016-19]|nr:MULTISPECIES: hypothetical protein [unclassified Pedobacter]MBE5321598.1 hypothetical protein [Pedobacter sp. MR2016-19]QXU43553.1 hypothetical protein KYH19_08205 [Pedobacter sp. D749]
MKTKKLNKRTLFVFKKNYTTGMQAGTIHSDPTTSSLTTTVSSGILFN